MHGQHRHRRRSTAATVPGVRRTRLSRLYLLNVRTHLAFSEAVVGSVSPWRVDCDKSVSLTLVEVLSDRRLLLTDDLVDIARETSSAGPLIVRGISSSLDL